MPTESEGDIHNSQTNPSTPSNVPPNMHVLLDGQPYFVPTFGKFHPQQRMLPRLVVIHWFTNRIQRINDGVKQKAGKDVYLYIYIIGNMKWNEGMM